MKIIKHLQSNIVTLIGFCWKINKSLFWMSALDVVLNTFQPFVLLFATANIINVLTVANLDFDKFLSSLFMFIFLTGSIKMLRMLSNVGFNMAINESDMKTTLFFEEHFFRMPYELSEDSKIRDLQKKVRYNIHPPAIFVEVFIPFLTGLLQIIGYSYIVFTLHPFLLMAILGTVSLKYFFIYEIEKRRYSFQQEEASNERKLSYLFQVMSNFDWAKDIKINHMSESLITLYQNQVEGYRHKFSRYQKKQIYLSLMNTFMDFIQALIQYGYSAFQAILGNISIGEFTIYLGAITNLLNSFNTLVEAGSKLNIFGKSVDEYQAYLYLTKLNVLSCKTKKVNLHLDKHEIEFVDVYFRYPGTNEYVLKDISIKISSGERLAIVGYNGAGKSTFIKLLCRLYEPTTGTILYNGVDIKNFEEDEWRELIGVVFQDFSIFSFPLWENIVLSRLYDEKKLNQALHKSGLWQKVNALENGLQTEISKRFDEAGVELSGGEAQKLACARTYYKDAPIVILDEPTSALDPKSEIEMYKRFDSIIENKTAVYVTHRLASVGFCNKVAVFSGGKIIEYGTHKQLMDKRETYYDLYTKQAQYYFEERE